MVECCYVENIKKMEEKELENEMVEEDLIIIEWKRMIYGLYTGKNSE